MCIYIGFQELQEELDEAKERLRINNEKLFQLEVLHSKRDLHTWQRKPTYIHGKRDLHTWQRRPTYIAKERLRINNEKLFQLEV